MSDVHASTSWPLRSVSIDNTVVPIPPPHLLLDRANFEFGVFLYAQPGVAMVVTHPDNHEPVYFAMSKARGACSRFTGSCKKVCVQMHSSQLDFEFVSSDDATEFVRQMGILATRVHNTHFEFYEATSAAALNRADFSIEKSGYLQGEPIWMTGIDVASEWSQIYKSGKCSDFTVVAGNKKFPVHRVLLSTRSQYFNAVCDGQFMESESRTIHLPEPEQVIAVLLDEIYEVYNPTTGSIFTNFAQRLPIEKEQIMNDLVVLFIAADKYSLAPIKQKVADAITDRLPFLTDPLSIVDLAACIHGEQCPAADHGLRAATAKHVQVRMPDILADGDAWEEYARCGELLRAYHALQCEALGSGEEVGGPGSPGTPKTPGSGEKRKRGRF